MTEGKPLHTASFIDILPDSLQQDKTIQAAAAALDSELSVINEAIPPITLWHRIDSMTEPELSTLAGQFSLIDEPVWGQAEDDETKRELLQGALELHRNKGTPWAIREVMRVLGYGEIELIEGIGNLHYDGIGEHDGVYTYGQENAWAIYDIILGPRLSVEEERALRATLLLIAPARCHLDQFLPLYKASLMLSIDSQSGVVGDSTARLSGQIMMNWQSPLKATWVTLTATKANGKTETLQTLADNQGHFIADWALPPGGWTIIATTDILDPLNQTIHLTSDPIFTQIEVPYTTAIIRLTKQSQSLCHVSGNDDPSDIWLEFDDGEACQDFRLGVQSGGYKPMYSSRDLPLNTPFKITIRNASEVHFHSASNIDMRAQLLELVKVVSKQERLTWCEGQKWLTTLHKGVFDDCPNIASAGRAFYNCSSLTTLPDGVFAGMNRLSNAYSLFQGCSSLKSLPAGLFADCRSVTTFSNVFRGCSSLTTLPDGVFAGMEKATMGDYVFYECSSLKVLPENLFADCHSVTTFSKAFYGCSSLITLPEGLFSDCTKVNTYALVFYGCTSLTTIPKKLFQASHLVTTFLQAFYGCSSLTTLPDGVFAGMEKATAFNYVFYGCSSLKALPEDLFVGCRSATTFAYAFQDCSSLTALPESLFRDCTNVLDYSYVFSTCRALIAVPEKLFQSSPLVTTFNYTFGSCLSLTAIPPALFSGKSRVTTYSYVFDGCSSLTSIPEVIFSDSPSVTNFVGAFRSIPLLTVIPADLFRHNTAVIYFGGVFQRCTSLSTLPDSLFRYQTKVTGFNHAFSECEALTVIPAGLFATNLGVENMEGVFNGCSALRSSVSDILTEAFLPKLSKCPSMFADCWSLTGEAMPFIDRHPNLSSASSVIRKDAFKNCIALNDYSQIPIGWR